MEDKTQIRIAMIGATASIAAAVISAWASTAASRSQDRAAESAQQASTTAATTAREVLSDELDALLAHDLEWGGLRIGDTGWFSSYRLEVSPAVGGGTGVSEEFTVPKAFTGLVIVHGPAGNYSKLFAVGSDGNSRFWGAGGFVEALGDAYLAAASLEHVAQNRWRLVGLNISNINNEHIVEVGLIGIAERFGSADGR